MKTSSALVAVLLSLGLGASAQVPGSVPGRPVAPATPPTGMVPVIYQGAGSVSGPGREGGGVTVNPGTNYFTAKNVPIYGSVEVTASHGLSCLMYFSGQANVSGIGFLGKGQVDGWGYVQGTCDLADKSGRVVTTIGMDEGVKVTGSSDGTFVHIHGDFPISGVVSVDASKLPQDSSRPDELIM
ncbi:MAG: hypothetical protein KGK30_05460, partial [Elusimicrobia bacterium]|nr:hypothetical protein [Elusimicrobiota bacterium]